MQTKILLYDIETSPLLAYTWTRWQEGVIDIADEWYMMSYAYRWLGDSKVKAVGLPDTKEYKKDPTNDYGLAKGLWDLLDEASIVVGHNSNRFDNRKVNARLIKHGFTPPSPYQTIDTKNVAKKYFAFDSNKLTHLGQYLNLGQKVETGGFQLWIDCMAGKEDAWKRMIKYNKQDVELLTQIYLKLRPWIDTHHNINVLDERMGSCPKCGSEKIQKRGFSITRTRKRQRYHCQDCGAWSVGALDGEPILVR